MDIKLIHATENDSEFFMELFSEIKGSELLLHSWPPTIREQLLSMQYRGFMKSIQEEYPNHEDFLILFQSKMAGRLQIEKNDSFFRIINISLMPDFRGKGIGSYILKNILKEANLRQIPVELDVDVSNPAFFVYQNLGFNIIYCDEVKILMKYFPEKS
jgi:ribosomal protein S18 acetylase RimI-like enzyme